MREILFKAKRMDNGEWVMGGSIIQFLDDGVISFYIPQFNEKCICTHDDITDDILGFENCRFYKVDADTICQCTGLTDKNGNKIWENDITRDNEDDMTMVVRWDNEKLKFVFDDYGMTGCLMEYGWDENAGRFDVVDTYEVDDCCNPINEVLEVIGNIFDNPDLLKEGD